jgi:hypothetical protein
MLINNDPFTFTLVVVYHDGIYYFILVTNLPFKLQLHLELPLCHIRQDSYKSLLTTVKLKQNFEGGSSKDKKCPVFSGKHGIEGFLYIEEMFRKIASHTLSWTTGPEFFEGFEEVLLDTALMNWEDLVAPIADTDKTPERFEQMLQAMYRKYVGAKVRDIQFEYFRTLQNQ